MPLSLTLAAMAIILMAQVKFDSFFPWPVRFLFPDEPRDFALTSVSIVLLSIAAMQFFGLPASMYYVPLIGYGMIGGLTLLILMVIT